MSSTAEQIQQLRTELETLKVEFARTQEILSKIFDHRDMSMEVRREWFELTRSWREKPTVESQVSEPPLEKGEAQQALETIEQLQRVFQK